MDNVETGDEDVRKNLRAIPSAKAVNPHQQQQQQKQQQLPHQTDHKHELKRFLVIVRILHIVSTE